ncbi:autoinducer 2 ABC transporter permease LsrC [Arsenicitalea aurantiaca]|uniref:Autoinducer 2 import system permease protein LsrC n=1 Tax=Arsenicitalea aurantiaca TaxID=1783274 RepID=A0A433X462_9HYPH|nr:autoinducer 2 ABC transporter permease LsrC [Arsenicitalea aurantiaca]RUT28855.1 autoinducer 2 ABC transporter permease LsrC [Arsenicitalea aurantiaca]
MLELFARNRVATLFVITLLTFGAIGLAAPGFLSASTLATVMANSLVLMLVSFGTMLVIITRNIDVSSGSVLGLSAAVLGLSLNAGIALPLAIGICIGVGALAGAFNGLLVAGFGVPSIVATLGTLGLYRGLMLSLTGGRWIEALPQSIKALAANLGWGGSVLTLIVLGVFLILWLFLRMTRQGGYFFATGDNREAARHLGIPVRSIVFSAFVGAGACAALAGVVFAAQIGFIPNQAGNGIELKAIAANVLGGVSLLGGVGSAVGVFISVIFLTAIDSALVFLRIPAFWNDFIAGAILLTVLVLDGRVRMAVDRRIRAKRYASHHGAERTKSPSRPSATAAPAIPTPHTAPEAGR